MLTLNGGSVAGNTAGVGGGIISFAVPDLPTGPVTINDTSIVGNEARLAGRGIADFGEATVTTTPAPTPTAVPSPPVTGVGPVAGRAEGPPVVAWPAALTGAALVGLGLVAARYRRRA